MAKQFAAEVHRAAATYADAKEQCEQLGVAECLGTTGEQFFPRAFVRGPVGDRHARSVCRNPLNLHLYPNVMNELKGRKLVLGVTGGVAAYKAAELTRLLVKAGAEVHV